MKWLKSALATVYSKDGLVGVAVIVGLGLAAVAVVTYFSVTPASVAGWLGL